MTNLSEIIVFFENWAPPALAMHWDNSGLQMGELGQSIKKVGVALDVDQTVIKALNTTDYDLIITHHPLFFQPIKCISYRDYFSTILNTFMTKNCALYSAHTNLDAAPDGVNDCLIDAFQINPQKCKILGKNNGKSMTLKKTVPLSEFSAKYPCQQLGSKKTDPVKRVAFCCGSGKGIIPYLLAYKIDLLITGELSYHDLLFCELNDIRVLTLGHKESELFIVPQIVSKLSQSFPSLNISNLAELDQL